MAHVKEIKFAENPIGSEGQSQALRQIVLALMPQLKLLNGSEITSRERNNAERMYLSSNALQYLSKQRGAHVPE